MWKQGVKRLANDINNTPWKRHTAVASFIALYTATGIAGYQYLQDTRHRATGEPNPYKPMHPVEPEPTPQIVAPHDTTPVYDQIASEYDKKIGFEEITSYVWLMRRRVGKQVTGDVLEIACGTGRNIGWLKPAQITSLTMLDASRPMLQAAEAKFDGKYQKKFKGKPVQFVQGKAEGLLKLTANSRQKFDTVFETFGLCSHQDPDLALQQMGELLKPGGKIVLLEHGRGTFESMNLRMDKRAEERAKEWGCRWNLDIRHIVENAGFKIVEEDNYHFGTMYFYVLKK